MAKPSSAGPEGGRKRLGNLSVIGLGLLAFLLSLPLLAGFLGAIHPALDAFAHFRIYLAVLLALNGLALCCFRQLREGVTIIALALLALSTTAQVWPFLTSYKPVPEGKDFYRLLHANLKYDNLVPQETVAMIERISPDIVTLNEFSDEWREPLRPLYATYRYRLECPASNGRLGSQVLSLTPIRDGTGACAMRGRFNSTIIELEDGPISVQMVHLSWPWPYSQAEMLEALASYLKPADAMPSLVSGDFNAVPWSWTAHQIAQMSATKPVAGLGSTYLPLSFPEILRKYAGLPLDQAFSEGVTIHDARSLPALGSDHRPIIITFTMPNVRARPEASVIVLEQEAETEKPDASGPAPHLIQ